MFPTRRKNAQSAAEGSLFRAKVAFQARIIDISDCDEKDATFTVEHEIDVDGHDIIYTETFINDLDDPRVKTLLRDLAPYNVTADNLNDAIGFREEITMAEVYKPSRGKTYWNIRTRKILGPETE